MELTLSQSWVKSRKRTKKLEPGMTVKFWRSSRRNRRDYAIGEIKEDEEGFYIEWEDIHEKTRIDDSEKSQTVLKDCEWE